MISERWRRKSLQAAGAATLDDDARLLRGVVGAQVLAQPAARERLQEIGFEVGQPRSVDELTTSLRADHERMGAILKSIGFKPE